MILDELGTIYVFAVDGDQEGQNHQGVRTAEGIKAFIQTTFGKGCDLATEETRQKTCTEKEVEYYEKMIKKDPAFLNKELDRLKGISEKSMSKSSKSWFVKRMKLLEQLVENN